MPTRKWSARPALDVGGDPIGRASCPRRDSGKNPVGHSDRTALTLIATTSAANGSRDSYTGHDLRRLETSASARHHVP